MTLEDIRTVSRHRITGRPFLRAFMLSQRCSMQDLFSLRSCSVSAPVRKPALRVRHRRWVWPMAVSLCGPPTVCFGFTRTHTSMSSVFLYITQHAATRPPPFRGIRGITVTHHGTENTTPSFRARATTELSPRATNCVVPSRTTCFRNRLPP